MQMLKLAARFAGMSVVAAAAMRPQSLPWLSKISHVELAVPPKRSPASRERCLVLARAASSSSAKPKQLYVCSDCGEQSAQW